MTDPNANENTTASAANTAQGGLMPGSVAATLNKNADPAGAPTLTAEEYRAHSLHDLVHGSDGVAGWGGETRSRIGESRSWDDWWHGPERAAELRNLPDAEYGHRGDRPDVVRAGSDSWRRLAAVRRAFPGEDPREWNEHELKVRDQEYRARRVDPTVEPHRSILECLAELRSYRMEDAPQIAGAKPNAIAEFRRANADALLHEWNPNHKAAHEQLLDLYRAGGR